ncbi:hypothetical protein VUR80DRAFT_3216 [Thermomyces stellatus]
MSSSDHGYDGPFRGRWTNSAFVPDRSCRSAGRPGFLFSDGPLIAGRVIGRGQGRIRGLDNTPAEAAPTAPRPRSSFRGHASTRLRPSWPRRSSAVESGAFLPLHSIFPEYASHSTVDGNRGSCRWIDASNDSGARSHLTSWQDNSGLCSDIHIRCLSAAIDLAPGPDLALQGRGCTDQSPIRGSQETGPALKPNQPQLPLRWIPLWPADE